MKPSGILNFENVPADAGDPDVKVYVNGVKVNNGSGGDGNMVITQTREGTILTLDKTYKEILDALEAGTICVLVDSSESGCYQYLVQSATYDTEVYTIAFVGWEVLYQTDSEDGYPALDIS